ncbi:MAG: ASKHA domain-containing protein [bacterium]
MSVQKRSFHITIEPAGKAFAADSSKTLKEVLLQAGYYFPQNCGGKGRCGYCRIEYHDGSPPPLLPREREILGGHSPYRLACLHKVSGDHVISLPILQEFVIEKSIAGFMPSNNEVTGLGLAVDLGTTVIAVYLLNLQTGEIIAQSSLLNPQVHQGGDVMTRLEKARDAASREELTALVRRALTEGIESLLQSREVSKTEVRRIFIAGNTAMTHLFWGYSGSGLETAPFRSPLEKQGILPFDSLWLELPSSCVCEMGPIIQGFIGSDTVAAIIASGLDRNSERRLLIDLGTNGEIVLAAHGNLLATSTAAGPAFEGVGMQCGMPALRGAIEGFGEDGEPFVIGSGAPLGFCGSGYMAALARLRKRGLLASNGLLQKNTAGERRWVLAGNHSGVPYISQDDVRKFQYAKGAIAAGIRIICQEAGMELEEIEEVFITGSFGNRIDPQAALEIGLIPAAQKVTFVDNGAGRGALLCLSDSGYRERALALQQSIHVINLGEHPKFQDIYISSLNLDRLTSTRFDPVSDPTGVR